MSVVMTGVHEMLVNGISCTHYWRSWKGRVFLNHCTFHKYYRRTKTLVDYFRETFVTFLHYNHTINLIDQHFMDSSHHHTHSTLKLLSSRHTNHQAVLMYWDAKKQQGTASSCVAIVPVQNILIVHIFKVEHVVPAINRIWLNTHIISRNSVYQINK